MADVFDEKPTDAAAELPKLDEADNASKRTKPTLLAPASTDTPPTSPRQASFTVTVPRPEFKNYAAAVQRRRKPLMVVLGAIVVVALGFGGGWLGAAVHP